MKTQSIVARQSLCRVSPLSPVPMRRPALFALSAALLLTACTAPPAAEPKTLTFEENLQNPLFADRYWTELTDRMVTMTINKDPILKDAGKLKIADKARLAAVEKQKAASAMQSNSMIGAFSTDREATQGYAMLKDGHLYLSTDFVTYPGVNLHLYLTSVVDPRDAAFPDPTAIDLGALTSPYGAQTYLITKEDPRLEKAQTVVLFDKDLERIYAFAFLLRKS